MGLPRGADCGRRSASRSAIPCCSLASEPVETGLKLQPSWLSWSTCRHASHEMQRWQPSLQYVENLPSRFTSFTRLVPNNGEL